MPKLSVPVIGIGAGVATDGQVLVLHDLLGIFGGRQAKFVKRYADAARQMLRGVGEYAREVRERSFPGPEHAYSIEPEELDAFRRYLEQREPAGAASAATGPRPRSDQPGRLQRQKPLVTGPISRGTWL